jgi:acetoin utilization deacetylase AcuC-like enzyme
MKCVIVDVDFHHGNGVEEILQRSRPKPIVNGNHDDMADDWRDRCKYISLHAHPDYPYYTTHLPTSLPKSVTAEEYLQHLRTNLDEVKTWCTNDTLVLVSLGLDTLSTDPIGGFAGIEYQSHFKSMGGEIGNFVHQINGKTCFLLEGGYVVDKLGECVEGVFRGYMQTVHRP